MSTAMGFAEMFEWFDGNTNNEDRAGCTVALFQGKIVLSTACPYHLEPSDIIGVVGGDNTSVAAISNASPMEWHGKHLRDEYNRLLWEDQSMVEWTENGYRHWYEADRIPAGITVPLEATYYHKEWNGHLLRREVLSEEYKNPGKVINQYLPRWDRPEWGIVVIAGRAIINEGSICNPSWKRLKPMPNDQSTVSVAEWLIQ
jgi:hypothetical protein